MEAIGTIGVYGTEEAEFFARLQAFGADCLVDIRQRRGVRGARYAYANRTRLEAECTVRGIAYEAMPELAPPRELRQLQLAEDARLGTKKRNRGVLGDAFREGYVDLLRQADRHALQSRLALWNRPVLLCVEGPPAACHRSLAAEWLVEETVMPVEEL